MAVNPPRTPPPPRLPHPGVTGRPAGKARNQLTVTSSRPSTSPSSPTWASVVRGEAREGIPACSGSQPAALSVAEFSALYERCVASGLKASVSFRHAAGVQVITVTCNVPVPAATDTAAGRRRRRRRHKRRRRRAATAGRQEPVPLSSPSWPAAVAAVFTAGSTPPARSRTPPAPPTPPSPETQSPPSKRTRRCRNELELLRDSEDDNEIILSPLSPSGPAKPPSATPPSTRHVTSPTHTFRPPPAQPFQHPTADVRSIVAYPGLAHTADTAFTTGLAAPIGGCYSRWSHPIAIDTAAICNISTAIGQPDAYRTD
jgi:hypothetical protein